MRYRTLLALCMVIILTVVFIPAEVSALTEVPEVAFPSQDEIVTYAQEHPPGETYFDISGNQLKDYKISYEQEPSLSQPYAEGALALEEQIAALNTVRLIRYIAGVSDSLYLFDPYVEMAQSAALINYANGKASHSPKRPAGMDIGLSAMAMEGAQNSNIDHTAWQNNSLKSSILYGWMYDSDSANIKTLGHRRWILNPSLVMTGFGSVTGEKGTFNTMYIRNEGKNLESVRGICWPALNTPISYFDPNSAWSISLGEEVDESSVVVSLIRIRDYKIWTFSSASADGNFYVNNQNYGQKGCIIFKPKNIGEFLPGDRFSVYVSYNDKNIGYEVNFFDLEHYYSTGPSAITSLNINPVDKPSIEWKEVDGADSYDLYRKAYGGKWKLVSADMDEPYFDDASAVKGIKYSYRVVAKHFVNGTAYESEPSTSKSITMKLSKASLRSVKSSSAGKNLLQWKKVSKATGYKIYRRVSGKKTWSLVGSTKSLSYTDSKAARGTKYEYRIRAYRTTYKNTVYGDYSAKRTVRTS